MNFILKMLKIVKTIILSDIKKVKDSRKDFEKISDELDGALVRNANAPRSKPVECDEANNLLKAKRSCFAHASLDHVFQVCPTITDSLFLSRQGIYSSFFHIID